MKKILARLLALTFATALGAVGALAQNTGQQVIVQLWATSVAGTANAVTISIPNFLSTSALHPGYEFHWVVASANTGATTVNPNGTGAKALDKAGPGGLAALTGGELQPGMVAVALYDGAELVLQAPFASGNSFGTIGSSRQLTGSAAGGGVTASWTATELIAKTADGGTSYLGAGLSLSFNGAGTGAGGMDAGSVPSVGDLYVYAIYNPTTTMWNTLGTTTADAGTNVYQGTHPVSGYTVSALIWVGKTSSSDIVAFSQMDRSISIATANAFSGAVTSSNTYQTLSLSSIVPADARTVSGFYGSPVSGQAASLAVAINNNGLGEQLFINGSTGGTVPMESYYVAASWGPVLMATPQQISFKSITTSLQARVDVSSYTF